MILKNAKNRKNKMKVLKKILLHLLLWATICVGVAVIADRVYRRNQGHVLFLKPCRMPLKYSVGEIDPRFNISQEQLKNILSEAEVIWEKKDGLNFFEYDPNAELQIKMVYDERQKKTDEAEEFEANFQVMEKQQLALDRQYGGADAEYDKKLSRFNVDFKKYEKDLKNYGKDVNYWNERGGVPADEYDKLKKERKKLEKTYTELKNKENELNNLATKINGIVKKENILANQYNSAVITYRNKYGEVQEFEKGVYDSAQGITVYQFKEASDLRLALAHELGHALGVDHTEDPKSIMYYLMSEQDLENSVLAEEDLAQLKKVCELN
jgi:hypothetical protein